MRSEQSKWWWVGIPKYSGGGGGGGGLLVVGRPLAPLMLPAGPACCVRAELHQHGLLFLMRVLMRC